MIAHTFDEALTRIRSLVADFRRGEAHFLSPAYNEARVREDFINRFWMALGWDVTHDVQKNPYEREVEVEAALKIEGRGKRADYSFAVAPNFRDPRFLVEAKKPSRQLANAQDYFQTVRYGWHAHTPVAVLTDFAELHVLDCRYKPDVASVLGYAALQKFHYTDYADEEKFRRIYHLFSREAVAAGALAAYSAQLPKPAARRGQRALPARGAFQSIDEAFLQDLDGHREQLARAFKSADPALDGPQLTEATQRTLDRLVFMRFLEDKLIEADELVEPLAQSGRPWADFVAASQRLNRVYNGIIFRPHDIDAATFRADESAFRDICAALSHHRSVYRFDLIPIHILGSIYERFLGKRIVATEDAARVEDKPEARKAGGVYYTPEYVVRYIVGETVGRLVAGKTPEQVRAMRFADIACGSGSFLLGVYDLLLRFHAAYYNRNRRTRAEGQKAGAVAQPDGTLRLSLLQKRTILLNNVYGVDVDAQAAEVAQLSLYLKLLEEETTATAHAHQLAFREALLPSLSDNVKSGNSLVDWDISAGQLFDRQIDPRDELKLNPMSFAQEFPRVMRGGGFDAIVGNPPYRMLQPHNTDGATLSYLRETYVAAEFKIEISHLFLQRAVSLLKGGGYLGYIVPTTLLNNVYAEALRDWLLGECRVELISVARGRVFADADVHTSVVVLRREPDEQARAAHEVRTTSSLGETFAQNPTGYSRVRQERFQALPGRVWNIQLNEDNAPLITRLTRGARNLAPLEKVATINRGLVTGDRDKYFAETKKTEAHAPILTGGDVNRYFTKPPSAYVLFERPRAGGGCWDREVHFAPHKIVMRQIGEQPTASLIREPFAVTANVFTVRAGGLRDELYLLGLINSKLIAYFWRVMFADFKSSFPQVTIFSLSQIPIREIDFSDAADAARHDRVVALVEQMLGTRRQSAGARTEAERGVFERKCAAIDGQLDELVYELYGLTEAERALVEGGNR